MGLISSTHSAKTALAMGDDRVAVSSVCNAGGVEKKRRKLGKIWVLGVVRGARLNGGQVLGMLDRSCQSGRLSPPATWRAPGQYTLQFSGIVAA